MTSRNCWCKVKSRTIARLFRLALWGVGVCLIWPVGLAVAGNAREKVGVSQAPQSGYTIYVVPHSHIDIVWYWTYDKTQTMAIKILRQVLANLKKDARYTFTQDQVMALEPFWNSLSDDDKHFMRRMVRERRFEVAGGVYVQPEIAEPDFESLTRQLLFGKPWMEKTFGAQVVTGWNIDTYGQTIQMPQLFRRAGLRYFVFMRDVLPSLAASIKSPFYWRSPDGSTLLCYWLSGGYDVGTRNLREKLKVFLDHNVKGNDKIFLPWGNDLYFPNESTAEIERTIRTTAQEIGVPIKAVVFSTPSQYFKDVEKGGVSLPSYTYDFNPPLFIQDLRGLYGQRPKSKQANRRAEDMLESSEKFSTVASAYGSSYPFQELRRAWKQVLFNQDHDAIPGSHTDPVDEAMMSRYYGAIETGRATLAGALYYLSRRVNTSGSGEFPFLVFNALSYKRTEIVRYTPLFKETVRNFRLMDAAGNPVPFRTVDVFRRAPHGPLSMAVIEFIATDVPALGYRLYHIEPIEGDAQGSVWRPSTGEISNQFFVLRLDPATGSIASIVDRRTDQELLDTSHYQGNELVFEEEKDPDNEGMLHLTGKEVRSSQSPSDPIVETKDALGESIRMKGPFLGGQRMQEIMLYNQLPRIDFKTKLFAFPGHDGMLTAAFPLQHDAKVQLMYETNNAVTLRPDGIYDAQTWVDAESSGRSLALINHGMGGYYTDNGILKLTLLRSITNYRGYYCPDASEAGTHTFEYSLYPHNDDWSTGAVVEQAHSFNSLLTAISTDAHHGQLPPEHSFLSVESGHFEVTALKKAEGSNDLILRGHESYGKPENVRLWLDLPIQQAWLADLLEKPSKQIVVRDNRLELKCQPFEFVTLRVRPKR